MTDPIPQGAGGIIPHLQCANASAAIDFYKKAFGAEELRRMPAPDGKRLMHAALKIGNQMLFLADDFPEYCGGKSSTPAALGATPVTLHQYVNDCDAAFERAVKAGATPVMPPTDMFWGDRYSMVKDLEGHSWSLATHQREMTDKEMAAAAEEMFKQAPQN